MSYQEEEKVRLRRQASKQAIALAMQGQWQEAVAANKSLLESFPDDVDAGNRLGKAYLELGEYSLAREAYEKVIEIDPYNTIARKNLERLSHLDETSASVGRGVHKVVPQQFIGEVGKAGVINLYQLAPPEILAKTVVGDEGNLRIDGSNLLVENSRREYLGQVEPKYGQRLLRLMEGGNRYTATIISSATGAVKVMIREVYQHPSQAGQLSFPPRGGAESSRAYAGERVLRRELEYEETLPEVPAYTIIGGDEIELLTEESPDMDEEEDEEE